MPERVNDGNSELVFLGFKPATVMASKSMRETHRVGRRGKVWVIRSLL